VVDITRRLAKNGSRRDYSVHACSSLHRMNSPFALCGGPPSAAGNFLRLGLANSGWGEPTLRPIKAAVGPVERAIAPEAFNRGPLAARRHAQFLERTFAERKALGIEKHAQLAARHQRFRCRRGWI